MSSTGQVFVLGIRHHGPGSTRRLQSALQQIQPDKILIEAPADATPVLPYIANKNLQPPVAILLYNPKDIQQATYLPFTTYSPEWVAVQYGLTNDIAVECFDLPMSIEFGVPTTDWINARKAYQHQLTTNPTVVKDPLAYLAQLAGYEDVERWWEVTFETNDNDLLLFGEIKEMITALRADATISLDTLRREAYMRKILRKDIKQHERIVVVCGAWHTVALTDLKKYKAKSDNALLKVAKKAKVKATWIPWTYERLASSSGYGAGVVSPAWYELLSKNRTKAIESWVVKAARLLRNEKIDTSTAHSTDTVRLAQALATLRGLAVAGIEELKSAAITILCEGEASKFHLVETKLIVGEKIGQIPEEVPKVPLQEDLDQQIKKVRLSKYQKSVKAEYLKANKTNPRGGIDLREAADLFKSQLLHQLLIVGIPFGELQSAGKLDRGSFKEYWKLKWKVDFYIRVIELSAYGNTIKEVAIHKLKAQTETAVDIVSLTTHLDQALKADLNTSINFIISKINQLAVEDQSLLHIMQALYQAAQILQHGNIRNLDSVQIETLIDHFFLTTTINLPTECVHIEEAVATDFVDAIERINSIIHLLRAEQQHQWETTLAKIVAMNEVHYKIHGFATRLLFDGGNLEEAALVRLFNFVFSYATPEEKSVNWLEGFTRGTGLLLIHFPELWQTLDNWVTGIPHESFQQVLPLIRKVFAQFSPFERQKMLTLANNTTSMITKTDANTDYKPAITTTVNLILGYS